MADKWLKVSLPDSSETTIVFLNTSGTSSSSSSVVQAAYSSAAPYANDCEFVVFDTQGRFQGVLQLGNRSLATGWNQFSAKLPEGIYVLRSSLTGRSVWQAGKGRQ
jgi:hypothetical protein